MLIRFTAPLWLWHSAKPSAASWHFITLPVDESQIIRMAVPRRGWGSVRVKATIGETSWSTSIFPASQTNAYLLPVKAQVRKAEGLAAGEPVEVTVSLDL